MFTRASLPVFSMSRNPTTAPTLNDDTWWGQVVARDPDADGAFWFGVRTTGIYCRPSCASRAPRRENVSFHATPAHAERAGFRACKRCKPRDASPGQALAARIADLCAWIASRDTIPSLRELSERIGMSEFHLQRTFKAAVGVTPRAYAVAQRAQRLREELRRTRTVTEAIYASGYGSSSRFYDNANRELGMTPRSFKTGGANTQIQFSIGECSLGRILVSASDRGVTAVLLGDDDRALVHDLRDRFPNTVLTRGDAKFERIVERVIAFVERPKQRFDLPLDIRGTAFQRRVWQELTRIRVGSTCTYSELAKRIGKPDAIRAVAGACAANPIAIAIPCHRVVRTNGELAGYRWGLERKRKLLRNEKSSR